MSRGTGGRPSIHRIYVVAGGFSLLLMGPLAHVGLALANSISAILNMALLVVFLAYRLGALGWKAILRSHLRALLASLPIIAACLWIAGLEVWGQPEAWVAKTIMLIVGIGLSVAGYVTIHVLLRSDEMDFLWRLVGRKLGRNQAMAS